MMHRGGGTHRMKTTAGNREGSTAGKAVAAPAVAAAEKGAQYDVLDAAAANLEQV